MPSGSLPSLSMFLPSFPSPFDCLFPQGNGYGDIVPKTLAGRMIAILVGISVTSH
jgi:hypothetical protein